MSIDRNRFDLKNVKESGAHKRAKSLVERFRAISLSLQLRETFDDITGAQSIEPADSDTVEVVNRSRRNRNVHREPAIDCILGHPAGDDLHIVITTCLVIRLETARYILGSRSCVRSLQQIKHLAAQRFWIVNRAPVKRNAAEEVLTSLVNRDDYIHFTGLSVKRITRCIDHRIQKTLGEIETMHQIGSFLHVSGNERQSFLRP